MSEKKFVKAKIFFEKGINFYLEGSYKFAENAFRDSLDLAPNRLSIINNLIKVYVKTQEDLDLLMSLRVVGEQYTAPHPAQPEGDEELERQVAFLAKNSPNWNGWKHIKK